VALATGKVVQEIPFPTDVALPTTYLNDVRLRSPAWCGRDGVHQEE
jgi:hypothetical protein